MVSQVLFVAYRPASLCENVVPFDKAFGGHEDIVSVGGAFWDPWRVRLPLRLVDNCALPFHAWYLDDGTIIGDSVQVAKALDIISWDGPSLGLQFNIRKTEVFWPSCDGGKIRPGLFPSDISRPERGVKLLGGVVSRDAGFISDLSAKRAARAVDLMGLLPRLRDPQRASIA
ncbi:reverse transcriptase domain-containing protein [Artemisia annua]|uniref:Reverse transcriptase domain-containing protein n=1 Tax=Artemisia annua TaxID=35608 RepID=A0A2U1LC15_ARTAN|nr:reverse transcriptase domain-containing protein [Artemisia annua]